MNNNSKKLMGIAVKIIAIFTIAALFSSNTFAADPSWGDSTGQPTAASGKNLKIAGPLVKTGEADLNKIIIVEKQEFDLWKACYNKTHDGTPYPGYSISFSTSNFACHRRSTSWQTTWDRDNPNGRDYYSVSTSDAGLAQNDVPIPGTITMQFDNAAHDVFGRKYKVVMTIDSVLVRVGRGPDPDDGNTNQVAMLFGYKKEDSEVKVEKGQPKKYMAMFNFSAFPYDKREANRVGIKYNVRIQLKDESGNFVTSSKRVPWAFSDIDISDNTSGSVYVYDPTYHPFAEHVKIIKGKTSDKIAISPNTELAMASDGAIYHNFSGTDDGRNNNSVNMLFSVDPTDFQFEWGGSGCSTELIDAPATIYTNETQIRYSDNNVANNTTNSPGFTDNKGILVHDNKSNSVQFQHWLTRGLSGTGLDVDPGDSSYVKPANSDSGAGIGMTTLGTFKKGDKKQILDQSFSVKMPKPGSSKVISQTFYYKKTNLNDTYVANDTNNTSCTLKSGLPAYAQCIRLYRPHAYFTGGVSHTITQKKTDGTTSTPTVKWSGNTAYVTLDQNADTFTLNFSNILERKDTGTHGSAGASESTNYKTYVEWRSNFENVDHFDGGNGTNKETTVLSPALTDGLVDTSNYRTEIWKKGYSSVKIKYGETIRYCDYLYYTHKMTGTQANSSAYVCVEVHRPEKTCNLDPNGTWTFGVNHGQNIGRIGVKNATKSTAYTWSPINDTNANWPSVFTADVWAKPGDNIQFKQEMCAGAFYVLQENGIKDRGTHYGIDGRLEKDGASAFYGSSVDGYLFKKNIAVPTSGAYANKYTNPARFYTDSAARWTTRQHGDTLMPGNGFLGSKRSGATDYSEQAEASFTSPDSGAGTSYGCSHTGNSATIASGLYQINGKQTGCHTNISTSVFDVGGTIRQTLFWNNYKITGVDYSTNPRTAISPNHNPETRYATASVKIPYNYVLAPYVKNENGTGTNQVVYLGETYKMRPGVGIMGRKNDYVNGNTAYATITKTTHVSVKTYYTHGGTKYYLDNINGASYTLDKRFNTAGNLNNSNEDSTLVNITIPDNGIITVGDKVCTEITVWPADSHDDPGRDIVHGASQGVVALLNNIGLEEGSRYGESNFRTTTSCSQVAKRPTMSVESSNAYSSAGYEVSNYTKVFANNGPVVRFASWSEYGVFGKVVKKDKHLVSGATTAYRTNVPYGSQIENAPRINNDTVNTATTSNSSTCVFRTQTFANTNCTENNGHDIGGDSVAQFRQKMVDRYGNIGNGATSGTVTFGGTPYKKVVLNTSNLGSHISNETGPIAIRANAGENLYIGEEGIPTEIPLGVEYDRTIVYNASGQTVVIDGNIDYNRRSGNTNTNLDNIVGVVIIAKNVYITNKPTYIDATIIADEVVNTCRYNGNSTAINGVGNLSASVCNQPLVFDAPVITKKLVLNRTAGAGNGNYSIQRAEIFNLSMANYLWGYNQMSRYSQAITTYSRELPSRY
ncbi:hypothetical protein IKF25_01560 [Candidatus Saccharibacteria bacterium]|nr:hypothetical protein [Candidatus Saccharibacteria bacterium]